MLDRLCYALLYVRFETVCEPFKVLVKACYFVRTFQSSGEGKVALLLCVLERAERTLFMQDLRAEWKDRSWVFARRTPACPPFPPFPPLWRGCPLHRRLQSFLYPRTCLGIVF